MQYLYDEILSAENELDHLSHSYSERSGKGCVRQDPKELSIILFPVNTVIRVHSICPKDLW